MYKCNAQRDISSIKRLDIWKNRKRGYTIRKVGVIDITQEEALILWEKLGEYLKIPDYKKQMEEEKEKFLKGFSYKKR